jgi:sialate O-acetylesterase
MSEKPAYILKSLIIFLPLAFLISCRSKPDILLPPFFSENMVLQQRTDAPIWGWAEPGSTVSITTSWDGRRYEGRADSSGKWKIRVRTPEAGGPYSLTVGKAREKKIGNVMIGEVWLCAGQSNMEIPMSGYPSEPFHLADDAISRSANPLVRLYTVPRALHMREQSMTKPADWKTAEPGSVAGFSAVAYFFGKILSDRLKVPVGLVNISYGGSPAEAWMNEEALREFPEISLSGPGDSVQMNKLTPTAIHNAMMHPFEGFAIRGFIWYQGESNYERPGAYESIFPRLVSQFRKDFGQGDLPFYYCQIAPYDYTLLPPGHKEERYNSAYLRDAQRRSLPKIPNSGMAVLMDVGEEKLIHLNAKETVGERLSNMALAGTYGIGGIVHKSPAFDRMTVKGSEVTLYFRDAPKGLSSFGKPLTNFEMAGADRLWKPAAAVIEGDRVKLKSDEIRDPIAVRYAFRNYVKGDLFGQDGLPVSSFRTDDW